MKAKKFRVTLTVLSFAIFNILKYRSKMYYWLADWEFCSHEKDLRHLGPIPSVKVYLGWILQGVKHYSRIPRLQYHVQGGCGWGQNWKTLVQNQNMALQRIHLWAWEPVSKMFCLTVLLPLLVQLVVAAFQALLVEARGCRLGCSNFPYTSPAYVIHANCSHLSFWRDLRSLSEGMMKSQLFSIVWW